MICVSRSSDGSRRGSPAVTESSAAPFSRHGALGTSRGSVCSSRLARTSRRRCRPALCTVSGGRERRQRGYHLLPARRARTARGAPGTPYGTLCRRKVSDDVIGQRRIECGLNNVTAGAAAAVPMRCFIREQPYCRAGLIARGKTRASLLRPFSIPFGFSVRCSCSDA